MREELKLVARTAHRRAMEQFNSGTVPTYLGVNGMLALMHRAIKDHIEDPSEDSLIDLVANGLFALHLYLENREFEEMVDDDPPVDDGGYAPPLRATPMSKNRVLEGEIRDDDDDGPPDEEDDGTGRWALMNRSGAPVKEMQNVAKEEPRTKQTSEEPDDESGEST